jgi:thiol-disulfide isomerase/thioredoxin
MNLFFAGLIGDRQRYRPSTLILVAVALLCSVALVNTFVGKDLQATSREAPELVGITRWINSDALTFDGQKGKVVVLHFWAFSCINCQRNLPYYNKWRKDFPEDKVQIIGVHTPETAQEADLDNVVNQVKRQGITYPIAVDNDRATWEAYQNRYWPSVYLIDKHGRMRARWEGELEYQKAGGDRMVRARIKELLSEEKE